MRWLSTAARRSTGLTLVLIFALQSCCGSCVSDLTRGMGGNLTEALARLSTLIGAVPNLSTGAQDTSEPCTVSTERQDVAVHVGPGEGRATLRYLPANEDIQVTGRASDDDGAALWQVALAGVAQAWVSAEEVTSSGACDGVPDVAAPPVIPAAPLGDHQGAGGATGGSAWSACGSCADCGADPSQCVLSPDGQCVWDAARCGGAAGASPPSGGGNTACVPDGQSYCDFTAETRDFCGTGELMPVWECRDSCGTITYSGNPDGCGGEQ